MISPYLDIYCKLMDFDPGATDGYLFCCGDAFERNQPESMWTSTVKKVFKTYSPGNTETPPKLLRSSFITFLRSEERTPELLKSCALGMKHALDTQASDVYDTATHDKLTKCSFDFCESFAKEFEMANGGAIPPPPPIPDTLGVLQDIVCQRGDVDGKVVFSATVNWHASMFKGATMTADTSIGVISFPVPTDGMPFVIQVPAPASVKSLTFSSLRVVSKPPEPDVVVRSREDATSSPTAVKANEKRLAEGRTAKQGKTQQPVSDALDQLSSLGWRVVEAEGRGDCSILCTIAGYEVKDEKEILNPSASTLKLVSKIRSASVSIVVGSAPIDKRKPEGYV